MAPNTRQYVLLGLIVAVLAVLLYRNVSGPGLLSGSATATGQAPAAPSPGGAVPDVALDRLEAVQPEPGGAGRNPFKMQPRTPPPAAASDVPAVQPAEPPVDDGRVSPAPSGPKPPSPIALKFIGIVQQDARRGKLAVLSDGTLVFYGREQEVIDGRYRIVRIGEESIEIEYVDGRGRQTIRLSGGS